MDNQSLMAVLEGKFASNCDNKTLKLYLAGPNMGDGRYKLGENFTLSYSKNNPDGSGISQLIRGTWSAADNRLYLGCREIEIEGWEAGTEDEDGHEEPAVTAYEGDDITAAVAITDDGIQLTMQAFDSEFVLLAL